jgi:hypothetical protein
MAKGDKPNPKDEFFFDLSLNPEFNQDIVDARKKLGIPDGGLTKETIEPWFDKPHDSSVIYAFFEKKKYRIPLAYMTFLYDYVLFGEWGSPSYPEVAIILPPIHTLDPQHVDFDPEEYFCQHNEPYARILVLGNGRKKHVLNFISKNSNEVEKILEKQEWKRPKMIRRKDSKLRTKRLKELWSRPVEDLKSMAHSKSCRRDILIHNILKLEGFGEVSEGYIRKMASK